MDEGGALPVIGEDEALLLLPDVVALKTGLKVGRAISEDEWLQVGGALNSLDKSIRWLIGDWMAYGEREYGKTYAEVAALFGYEEKTLYNLCWLCKRVKLSLRGEKLDIGHYMLLAAFDPPLIRQWLDYLRTLDKRPTVRELDAIIKGIELPAPRKGVARVVYAAATVKLQVEKLLRKKDGAARAELRALADEQIAYWQGVQDSLDKGE